MPNGGYFAKIAINSRGYQFCSRHYNLLVRNWAPEGVQRDIFCDIRYSYVKECET